jgi:hypothetical protein
MKLFIILACVALTHGVILNGDDKEKDKKEEEPKSELIEF